MVLITEKNLHLSKVGKINNAYVDDVFSKIENCNDALHELEKSLRLYLVHQTKEALSDSNEEHCDVVDITKRFIENFSSKVKHVESLLSSDATSRVEDNLGKENDSKEMSISKEDNENKIDVGDKGEGSFSSEKLHSAECETLTLENESEQNLDLSTDKEKHHGNSITCEERVNGLDSAKVLSFYPMNFNKIDISRYDVIPDGYFGFNYENLNVLNSDKYPDYKNVCFSPPNVAYNNKGKPASIKSRGCSPFTIYSLRIMPASAENLKVIFEGFDSNSDAVASQTVTLTSPNESKQFIFHGFTNLSQFKISCNDVDEILAIDDVMIAYDN